MIADLSFQNKCAANVGLVTLVLLLVVKDAAPLHKAPRGWVPYKPKSLLHT